VTDHGSWLSNEDPEVFDSLNQDDFFPPGKQMKARFLPMLGLGLTAHYCYADPASISVDLAASYRPVTHAASGSLYGLSFDGVPPDNVIDPLRPNMFTQMAPNGHPPLLPVRMARPPILIFFSRAITQLLTVTSSSR
jgi:hypothetical protein